MKNFEILNKKLDFCATDKLTIIELLAVVLGGGRATQSSVERAQEIVKKSNWQNCKLSAANISNNKQLTIKERRIVESLLCLAQNTEFNNNEHCDVVSSSLDIFNLYKGRIGSLPNEQLWVVTLNSSNRIIEDILLSQGGESDSSFSIKLLMKKILDNLSQSIILVHNHPGGALTPSQSDIEITKKISEAVAYFDINLLDHVIVSSEGYYSFAENRLL